ncbi:hypothetical protein HY025_06120 [Candidatus Daviesbacteria bacterium]|nr:hypothetical protein [Candidatus Daviesbacteria bacterium]
MRKILSVLREIDSPFFYFLLIGFSLLFSFNVLQNYGEQQFIYLAKSFLSGKLYFIQTPGTWSDTALFKNHYFWPLGPFPAVLLIPFEYLFGLNFRQGYLQFILNIINFILLYKIAQKITSNHMSSLWLSFGFIFSSTYLYIAMIPFSWYFAQIIGTFFILLSILEFLGRRRYLLIGIFIACSTLTRLNLSGVIIFFLIMVILAKNKKHLLLNIILLITPLICSFLLLFFYNYLRFKNIFQPGYSYQILYLKELFKNRDFGLWNLIHIPANIYYLFLKGPDGVFKAGTKVLTLPYIKPDPWGMSIFLTSPIFIWIFKAPQRENIVKAATITSLIMLALILGYYGIGVREYGYRYAVDFYPFLFILLVFSLKNGVSAFFKILSVCSFMFNFYLILILLSTRLVN